MLPAAAAGLTLALVAAALVLIISHLLNRPEAQNAASEQGPPIAEVIDTSKKRLAERGFHEAAKLLEEASERGEKHPELILLRRQARMLAGLLDMPLEEIIQKGQLVRRPEEWQAQLQDYKGRTILFDDVIRRDQDGSHQLVSYELLAAEEKGTVNLDLDLLRRLPLDQPRRVIFGARLANLARGGGGIWVAEFERDSGVLLTDENAAVALGLTPIDGELREVLRMQATWARALP